MCLSKQISTKNLIINETLTTLHQFIIVENKKPSQKLLTGCQRRTLGSLSCVHVMHSGLPKYNYELKQVDKSNVSEYDNIPPTSQSLTDRFVEIAQPKLKINYKLVKVMTIHQKEQKRDARRACTTADNSELSTRRDNPNLGRQEKQGITKVQVLIEDEVTSAM